MLLHVVDVLDEVRARSIDTIDWDNSFSLGQSGKLGRFIQDAMQVVDGFNFPYLQLARKGVSVVDASGNKSSIRFGDGMPTQGMVFPIETYLGFTIFEDDSTRFVANLAGDRYDPLLDLLATQGYEIMRYQL